MSLDLADHLAIKPGDAKEAVRQSKVMSAVEAPRELVEAEAKPAGKPIEPVPVPVKGRQPEPVKQAAKQPEPTKQPEVSRPVAPAEPVKQPATGTAPAPAPVAVASAGSKPAVELPASRPAKAPIVEKTPIAPPAPAPGISPLLVSILILVVIGAGAFFVWKFIINKPDESAQITPLPPKTPPLPPPPAVATSKIVMDTPAAMEIKSSAAGTVETIEAADKDVKAGDVIATLAGAKPLRVALDKLAADLEKAAPAIAAAEKDLADAQQKENNQAGVTAAQAKLDAAKKPVLAKQTEQKTKQAELDKLSIKATSDGKLVEPVKAGDKIAVDQVLAKVARPTAPVATFKIPAGTKIAADGSLSIQVGDKTVTCTVSDAQTETVKVTCPADQGLAEGADVKFTLPK